MNEILIYEDIGESWFSEGVTAKSVKSQLDGFNGDVAVRINSGGGDVFEGFAIYNLLYQYSGPITVHVDGLAASAASVIAMAGDSINMADNSLMMVHDPWTIAMGSSDELIKTAELLGKIKDNIVDTYEKKTGLGKEAIGAMMMAETWMNVEEAIESGFADKDEAESDVKVAAFDKPWIKNAPKQKNMPEIEEINPVLVPKVAAMAKKPTLDAEIKEKTNFKLNIQEKRLELLKE